MGVKRENKTELCTRCGRRVVCANSDRHEVACNRVPLPVDMAKVFRDNMVSINGLAAHYDINVIFIKTHLILGGVTKREIKERSDYVMREKPKRFFKKKGYDIVAGAKWKQRCKCGLLLFTKEQMMDKDPEVSRIALEAVRASNKDLHSWWWFISHNGRCGLCERGL